MQVVLRPGGQDQTATGGGPAVRGLGGGRHPLGGRAELVDRVVLVPGEVLQRAAGQPGRGREPHRLGHAGRIVREAVLQVGGHRQGSGRRDVRGVPKGLIPGHLAVESAQRGGEP